MDGCVHGEIACINDRVIKPQNKEQNFTCLVAQKDRKGPPEFSHNEEMRTTKRS